jgi:hypothetical protein
MISEAVKRLRVGYYPTPPLDELSYMQSYIIV